MKIMIYYMYMLSYDIYVMLALRDREIGVPDTKKIKVLNFLHVNNNFTGNDLQILGSIGNKQKSA